MQCDSLDPVLSRCIRLIVVPVRFAAEQRWSVACGETAGHSDLGTKKLRSSDVDYPDGQVDVAAPQLHNPDRGIPRARAPAKALFSNASRI